MIHKSVLIKEVLEYLNPQTNENFVDGTVGEGGHARLILEKNGPQGKVLGIDADAKQIENSKANLAEYKERVILINDSYANIKEIYLTSGVKQINGILLDLGYSSYHIDVSGKGFSFQKDEALDMRYGSGELTAEKIINEWPEEKIQEIIENYGEEKFARQIAKKIVVQRKIRKVKSTFELVKIIESAVPIKFQHGRIHCATRTFQALRIAVNGELENVQKGLEGALQMLVPSGRLVVISFHSLEDRIVKHFFREQEQLQKIKILTKKPIVASEDEISQNSRSKSAKLRAIIKV